jgi:hypothetical protein
MAVLIECDLVPILVVKFLHYQSKECFKVVSR